MEAIPVKIDEIYVPAAQRSALDREKVDEIAESILADGMRVPIGVRWDGKRYVLVSGVHRLEACKALGEETIAALVVRARQH